MNQINQAVDKMKNISKEVADGNPGAWRVVQELMWFSRWYEMMQWLKIKGITGSKLWMLYKDEHNQDKFKTGDYIQKQMGLGLVVSKEIIPTHPRKQFVIKLEEVEEKEREENE